MISSLRRIDPTAARLSLFYAAYFAVMGIMLPYWTVWLEGRGLSPVAIGMVLAVTFWVKLIAHPLMAGIADAYAAVRGMTILLSCVGLLVFAGFAWAAPLWSYLTLAVLAALTIQTVLPLGESIAQAEVKARGLDYGRVRTWGSIAFVAAAAFGGWALERVGTGIIHPLVLVSLAGVIVAAIALPRRAATTRRRWSWTAVVVLVLQRRFLIFVAAAGLVQASHGVYYAFGTIAWRGLGFGETVIGGLWVVGVVAEIALFWVAGRLGRLGTAQALLILGAVGALVRWPLTALADTPWEIAPLQVLHALTFGAAHLGAMRFLRETAPEGMEATAQALYYALVGGVIMGLAMPVAGWLYARFGLDAYHAMGVFGLVAAGLCLGLRRTEVGE
ncbi:MAG: MFS transporter [Alphaproteobacteria bacterium]|nr:MFS transporter [Alphaproteobacteria bacterium]